MPTGALLTPPSHNEYDEEAYGKLQKAREEQKKAEEQASRISEALAKQRARLERLFKQ